MSGTNGRVDALKVQQYAIAHGDDYALPWIPGQRFAIPPLRVLRMHPEQRAHVAKAVRLDNHSVTE